MGKEEVYTILIIDDEKANLMVLNKMLSSEYTVLTAKSGSEGLSRIEAEKPDLILLDIIMPDMNGFEILKRLKERNETGRIPVIIITGLDNEEDEEKGLLLGAVDYIIKPFKNAIVMARVKTHIQMVRQFKMIERLGLEDPLTGIPNRRCFQDRLGLEWRRAFRERKPLSFLMIDVDTFKQYNDTYGHPQGDSLLCAIAKLFTAAARRPGDLAARLGGEEFGVLLPETGLRYALEIAERIRRAVETARIPAPDGNTMTGATVSIGAVSCIPDRDAAMDGFIAQADGYLYAAKEQGRNRVCFGGAESAG
ncbi:MAG: diguanylate cyclase [Treponema sp.]|jgi:diguanylate cyclase (GGDEF)-like protein|nr:diguanylate cyclase [Treponema sp.]